VSVFVVSLEFEDRDEVEVATGRSTKRPSALNDIQCFSFGFSPLAIIFHYFSKLFPVSIKCQSDVNMK
jgi:hypothetical protein